MPKRTRRYKRYAKKTRKLRRGGTKSDTECCICDKKTKLSNTFVPNACLRNRGVKAHRICKDCWWDEEKGFAKESVSHKCPGCLKNPSPKSKKKSSPHELIDLTKDD